MAANIDPQTYSQVQYSWHIRNSMYVGLIAHHTVPLTYFPQGETSMHRSDLKSKALTSSTLTGMWHQFIMQVGCFNHATFGQGAHDHHASSCHCKQIEDDGEDNGDEDNDDDGNDGNDGQENQVRGRQKGVRACKFRNEVLKLHMHPAQYINRVHTSMRYLQSRVV